MRYDGDKGILRHSRVWIGVFLTVAAVTALVLVLMHTGVLLFDRSAERQGEGVYWNGVVYQPCAGEYTEGKTIAKTTDGSRINEVEEDDTHTFIVLRSFLDQYLLVREDYAIPSSGEITTVFWNGEEIADAAFRDAVTAILSVAETDMEYVTDGIYQLTGGQHMRPLFVGYQNCPIGTEFKGYMGQINGQWVITTDIADDRTNVDGSPKSCTVGCYTIPPTYHEILNQYLS